MKKMTLTTLPLSLRDEVCVIDCGFLCDLMEHALKS